jgi:alpha-L-rhamnosidase
MVERDNPDLLWRRNRGSDYADWLALDAAQPGDPTTPKDLIGTATFKHSVDAMIEMADATGRAAERGRYAALSAAIRNAFAKAYVQADGTVGNGSQTGYILALNYDLVPQPLRGAALDRLVADIRRRGVLLSTGFLGTPGSLDCLYAGGERRLIYDLLLRTAYPSWGYMVTHGATTIWERWNGDMGDVTMNSFNHYALGAVSGFVFRRIAGLTPLEPGFRRFLFDPVYDDRVPGCAASYNSAVGRIAVRWKRTPALFSLHLEVPPNAEAEVHLPARRSNRITEGGTVLREGNHVRNLSWTPTGLRFVLGSGTYDLAAAG